MRFKPVNLGPMHRAVTETHDGETLALPPPALPVPTAQSLSNGGSCRNRLGVVDRPDEFKIHSATLPRWDAWPGVSADSPNAQADPRPGVAGRVRVPIAHDAGPAGPA